LKTPTPDSTSAILPDVETLEHGLPTLRNLQKLALFAEEQSPGPGGERAWREGRLFERVFEGLMGFLQPSKVSGAADVDPYMYNFIDESLSDRQLICLNKDWWCFGRWSETNGPCSRIAKMLWSIHSSGCARRRTLW